MTLLSRLRTRLSSAADAERRAQLAAAEQQLRAGGAVAAIRHAVRKLDGGGEVERAWLALYRGDLEASLTVAYRAASSRPYDVDSRIVHGVVRLARNELEHAAHEFDAVIEEFGAEQDASDGRRAVILAGGYAPLDELPASAADWDAAAVLLTTLWRLAGAADARLAALQASGQQDGLEIVQRALARGRGQDQESGDGTV